MTRKLVVAFGLAGALVTSPLKADDARPVSVQVTEREPDSFLVQWQVPQVLPIQAMPTPVLPEICQAEGERSLIDRPGTWLNRQAYRCGGSLAGQTIRIAFPFHNPSLMTLIRVDFLSGERFAGGLAPGEESWEVPDLGKGAMEEALGVGQAGLLAGARHVVGSVTHGAFVLALCLFGGLHRSIRLVAAFALGQLGATVLSAPAGIQLAPGFVEICQDIATVLIAREALREASARHDLTGLVAAAGAVHALGIVSLPVPSVSPGEALSFWTSLTLVLGIDAAMLIGVFIVLGVSRLGQWVTSASIRSRVALTTAYVVGGLAVASALTFAFTGPMNNGDERRGEERRDSRLPGGVSSSGGAALPGSRPLAPKSPDAAFQSFLAIEAFEVRLEVLVKLADVVSDLDLNNLGDVIEIDRQADIKHRVAELVGSSAQLSIDGEDREAALDRVDFVTLGVQGVLPRAAPVRERLERALVGVSFAYVTPRTAQELRMRWETFLDASSAVPATVTDPEATVSSTLTPDQPELRWTNELSQDPIPTIVELAVVPKHLPLPLVSLALLVLACAIALRAARSKGERRALALALTRLVLALALVTGPFANLSIALPASFEGTLSEGEARRLLAGVLPNVYRAFEFREESAAYDRLALSVTGESLIEIYLEHRRALEMEERGGARARVEAVEVLEVQDVLPAGDGGFEAVASWSVGGMVTHFGHRHFRQNRYDTRIVLVPAEGIWKILSIEILNERRVR